jgi:Na+/phosphate symporter
MAGVINEMFYSFTYVFDHPEKKLKNEGEELQKKEILTDRMQEELTRYLAQCGEHQYSHENCA